MVSTLVSTFSLEVEGIGYYSRSQLLTVIASRSIYPARIG